MTRCAATVRVLIPAHGRANEAAIDELGRVDSVLPEVVLKTGDVFAILHQLVKYRALSRELRF